MDNLIMLFVLLFLGIDILYNAKYKPINMNFFDLQNSMAMRGFWCLVVILVHVPSIYGNKIQDMIGSFGYIGVTFFFMTSGYGLTLSQDKNYDNIKTFWRKRLPKLCISTWLVNILFALVNSLIFHKNTGFADLVSISLWVKWLIACYLAFWLMSLIFQERKTYKIISCIVIAAGSFAMYMLKKNGIVTSTIWSTECYGFIWGILLASCRDDFLKFFTSKWVRKVCLSALISLILGILYLRFKYVPLTGEYLLKIVLGLAITVFILIVNTRIEFGNKINQFLGMISFEIYIAHGFVFIVLEKIRRWNSAGLFIVCCMLTTILIAWFVHIISQRLVRITKKLLIAS